MRWRRKWVKNFQNPFNVVYGYPTINNCTISNLITDEDKYQTNYDAYYNYAGTNTVDGYQLDQAAAPQNYDHTQLLNHLSELYSIKDKQDFLSGIEDIDPSVSNHLLPKRFRQPFLNST